MIKLNKYKQRLISFASAAVMLITAIPAQSVIAETGSESATGYYFAWDGNEDWTVSGSSSDAFSKNGTSVTLTGTDKGGYAYLKLPDTTPTSGKIEVRFSYKCSTTERNMFALVPEISGEIDYDTSKKGFGVGFYEDSQIPKLQVLGENKKDLTENYTTPTTYRIEAVIDYDNDKATYKIYDTNNQIKYESTDDGIDTNDFAAQYLVLYVRNEASITVSDFVMKAEGADSPEPEEPATTPGAVVDTENTLLYDLDTADGETKGWINSGDKITDTALGGNMSYSDGRLTLSSDNSISGDRMQYVTIGTPAPEGTEYPIQIDASLTMSADSDGKAGSAYGLYTYFKLADDNLNDILSLKLGNDGTGSGETILYLNDEDTGLRASDSDNSISFDVIAVLDPSYDMLYVTIMQNGNAMYSANLPTSSAAIAYAMSVLHRGNSSNPYSKNVVDVLTIQQVITPKIYVAGTGGSINENGIVNIEIETGESVSMALLRNYKDVEISYTDNDNQTTVSDDNHTISNDHAAAEYVAKYDSITVRGKSAGELGPFAVTVTNGDNSVTRKFIVTVTDDVPASTPSVTELPTVSPSTLVNITFDGSENESKYTISDEYGETVDTTAESNVLTAVEDTNNRLVTGYSATSHENPSQTTPTLISDSNPTTTENPDNSCISGNAFYSFLDTNKVYQYSESLHRNVAGNGYRGSKLTLDNELVQRTDKIKVSYDFALYNDIKTDGGTNVGIPTSITMTSEGIGQGSIPYDFNSEHCYEIDADPCNTDEISKHLLTFFTGRPKRDDATGVHWVDMTNKLAYFDPRYTSPNNPNGKYIELNGLGDLAEGYNFFHVDAEVDFYNDVIEFTITNNMDKKETQTVTTTIPEHASWNGFIIASNKWDNGTEDDRDGQDTEHYVYLDNIKAEKIAEDNFEIDPGPVPTARPLPTDAVSFEGINTTPVPGKPLTTEDTWAYDQAEVINVTTEESDSTYGSYSAEGAKYKNTPNDDTTKTEYSGAYTFTHKIANAGDDDRGITSYTEFDFYLPKKGSYITLTLIGNKSNNDSPGNSITISTSGVSSWTSLEYHTRVYDELECGKWYSMQLVFDLLDNNMKIVLKDGDDILSEVTAPTRSLSSNYYRKLCFNPDMIVTAGTETGSEQTVNYPAREPSMALTYIANLRVYNRAVITEYYPEGTTANAETGDALNGANKANGTRLASVVTDFVHNQVPSDSNTPLRSVGALPIPPKNDDGKTFTGWKLIYTNGSNAESGTVGDDATRIKYAAVYGDLPVDSVTSEKKDGYYYMTFWTDLPILTPNYNTIQWYVYARENANDNYTYRMTGDFDLTGIHTQLSGDGNYRIGYVVYNIPDEYTDVIALPQAHHKPVNKDEATATELPEDATTPGPFATAQPQPSDAPVPASRPTPDPNATARPLETPDTAE